jgi:predicted DNA-binding transcriptional regulator AlpA
MYMTTKDIADTLGLTRAYVTDVLTKRADFPKPAVNISQKIRRWKRSDFEAWATGGRRYPQPTPGSTYSKAT